MNSTASLTGSHLRTFDAPYRHPVTYNLGWHDEPTLKHPDLAKRIVGSQVVDESHLSDGQLLEKASEHYFGSHRKPS